MTTDNPAGRLLSILEKGKKQLGHEQTRDAWRKILEIEGQNENDALLMSRLGKVMELPQQIITDIQTYFPRQVNSHMHWSTKVNSAFGQLNLNSQWNTFISHIDAHTMNYLSLSVDLLDTKEEVKILSKDDLKKIRNKIDKILQDMISLELDESFKKDIVKYLRKIIIAIDEYNITGITPIVESVESTLGHIFIDPSYRDNLMNTDFGKDIRSTLGIVADIITVSLGFPQITLITEQFLLPIE